MPDGARALIAASIVGAAVWFLREEERRRAVQNAAQFIPAKLPDDKGNEMFGKAISTIFKRVFSQPAAAPIARAARVETGEPSNIGAQLMVDLMRDFGLQKHQAAGVVGNLAHESGGFKSLQEIKPLIAGSRGGFGYAQWTGPRRRQFEAWVAERGLDARGYAANYGFLKHELTYTEERRVLPRLRNAKTVDEATRIFSGSSERGNSFDGFLRPGIPHMASRYKRARGFA